MTAITILSGDFEILFADEIKVPATDNAGMKMVRRTSGATETYYTTNELYSAIADAADDFQAMGFENPMLPVTPNAYTMENNYFIPRSSTEYLSEGAISADWSVASGEGVYMVEYTDSTSFVADDIGRQIVQSDSTDEGTLLDYEVLPDGTNVAWIRPNSATDLFDGTGIISVTADSGAGASSDSTAALDGDVLYSSIQVIGSIPTATEVYLIQERQKMTDWEGNFQWWATDPTVSLGIIDILIRVKNVGTLIAEGDVEVFSRKYTSLYDNFRLNVSAGGRSALPLASAADINNTTGYRTSGTLSGVTPTFTVGNGVYQGATWATATARGVITETDGTTYFDYYLVGDLTDLSSTTSTQEYDFSTAADADADATTGTVAVNSGGPTDSGSGEGGSVTIVPAINNNDHTGDSVDEPYSITVDAQGPGASGVTAAKVYERLKYVTRRGATGADLFGAVTNIPGETYRGLTSIIEGDASTVNMTTEGQDLTSGTGNWTARLIAHNHTPSPALPGGGEYITVTDEQTSIDVVADDYVISGGTEGDMTINTSVSPDFGIDSITSPKSSPLGTFTGTVLFGARGVAFVNPHDDDSQNYILVDDLGTLNEPPNTVSFTVSNTASGDRVLVARDTTTLGEIDKDQFGGIATGTVGASSITVGGTVDAEVPQSGYVRIVDQDLNEEHHYEYSSRTTGASGVFTLTSAGSGSASGGSATTMVDDGVNLVSAGAKVGMLINKTSDERLVYEIQSFSQTGATPNDTANVIQLYGTQTDWAAADGYTINTLIGKHDAASATDYDTDDDLYDLILDVEATGITTSNTFIQSTTFNTVANVRQGGDILPFTANPAVNASGGSVAVVRTSDTIHS